MYATGAPTYCRRNREGGRKVSSEQEGEAQGTEHLLWAKHCGTRSQSTALVLLYQVLREQSTATPSSSSPMAAFTLACERSHLPHKTCNSDHLPSRGFVSCPHERPLAPTRMQPVLLLLVLPAAARQLCVKLGRPQPQLTEVPALQAYSLRMLLVFWISTPLLCIHLQH